MKETFAAVESTQRFKDLELMYSKESTVPELKPTTCVDRCLYNRMEQTGMLHMFTDYIDGVMTGFLAVVISTSPHYTREVGNSESFFVDPAYRDTGAGLRLLAEAESFVKSTGVHGFAVSAQVGSRLDKMLSAKKEYRPVNKFFFKGFV